MRLLAFLIITFIAGQQGFVFFAAYLIAFCVAVVIVRAILARRRAVPVLVSSDIPAADVVPAR